jgi:hypothetical protein
MGVVVVVVVVVVVAVVVVVVMVKRVVVDVNGVDGTVTEKAVTKIGALEGVVKKDITEERKTASSRSCRFGINNMQ